MIRSSVQQLTWYIFIAVCCSLPVLAADLTGVTLMITPPSPQPLGTSITMTATPTGGATVEYLFGVRYTSGGVQRWITLRNYSTNPVFVDKPPMTGNFTYVLYAREQGATATVTDEENFIIGATPPPSGLTAVALAVTPPSPQPAGTQLTLTAIPTGGSVVEYLFGVWYANGTAQQWQLLQDYSTTPTFLHTPATAGNFTFEIRAREQGTTTAVNDQESYTISAPPPTPTGLTAVSLAVTPSSPQPAGSSLTLTATPTGGTTVEYLFGVWYTSGGTLRWVVLKNYSTNRVYVDKPPITGTFTYEVRAREKGTTSYVNDQESYTIGSTPPPALTAVSLAITPASPQPAGTQLTMTATPTGGATVQYLFGMWYTSNGTLQWQVLRDYATNAVFAYTPTRTGNLTFEVRAREQGATAYVNDQESYTIGSAPPTGLTAVSLAVTPPSPQPPGSSLTLTATPTGGTTVEYLFGVWYTSGGTLRWLVLRNYATGAVYVDKPPITGTFTYEVRAREQGTTTYVNDQENFTIGAAPAPLTAVNLAVTPPSPQPPGTQLTLTATPTGGTVVEYLFGMWTNGTQWQVLRDYATTRTFAYTPSVTGTVTFEVRAREQGATAYVSDQVVYTIGSTPPPASGRIAFISNRDGNDEVYVMNADGSSPRRLTNNAAVEMEESWSPDGATILFITDRDGTHEVYSVKADGTGLKRITNDLLPDWGPRYSPSGTKIYFFRTLNGTDEIHVMNPDGSNQVRLTNNSWFDVLPVLTPDGTKIVFDSDRNGSVRQTNYDIYVMNPDGTNQVRLTTGSGREWYHDVSPNGQYIAYTQDNHIRLMNIDGSNQHAITSPSGYQDKQPSFSPDGSKIAFASNRDGNWEIYIMNLDGSGQTRVTNNTSKDEYPAWSPQ